VKVQAIRRWWQQKGKPAWDKWKSIVPLLGLLLLTITWPIIMAPNNSKPDTKPISQFYSDLGAQKVKDLELNNDNKDLTVKLKSGKDDKYLVAYPDGYGPNLVEAAAKADVPLNVVGKGFFQRFQVMLTMMFFLVLLMLYLLMNRKGWQYGGRSSLRSSGVVIAAANTPTERFDDVGGADEVIDELRQTVDALKNPEKYQRFGVKPLTGYLLYGPPGTGKTLLARAIAGEAGVPFFAMKGSDFVGRWLNDGPRAVREVFAQARKHRVSIIFIDEIDSIASKRSSNDDSGSKELNNTLNELLAQLDGFNTVEGSTVLVIGATNRPDDLDPAIRRPGRLTRHAVMPSPDPKARRMILVMHTNKLGKVADDVSFDDLARLTTGMTGAQLGSLVNQAGMLAIAECGDDPEAEPMVAMKHFRDALEIAEVGLARKSREVAERDRNITAVHEGGHALVALLLKHADPPTRVTIVPRGTSGGHTRMDTGDWLYLTVAQLKARLAYYMGGRAAEKVLFEGDFTTGAEDDIRVATDLATYMVCEAGMGSKYTARVPLGTSGHDPRIAEVTDEIDKLVKQGEQDAVDLLTEHRGKLEQLRDKLLEVESLDGEALAAMFSEPIAA
jgi:cell division protease FtsH